MRAATLHVHSRGSDPEHDYAWMRVADETGPGAPERPPRLDADAARLVQSDSPSVLLLQGQGELLLFATAFESSRRDVQGRPIRTSIAVTTKEEAPLRALASWVLTDKGRAELVQALDEAVSETEDGGFEVSSDLLGRLLDAAHPVEDAAFDPTRRLFPNGADERRSLADELREKRLPPMEGPLVVVTGAVSAEHLEASGVWRGLSRLVASSKSRLPEEVQPPSKKGSAALRRRARTTLFLLGLLLALLSLWAKVA